ncbi:phosphatidylinositol-specific phospholipase C [Paraburkholderia sediminicola]|uniref:phosphatidylinositol-specific phospholipase C n=1 Tax=Paraburkholderia sediminicola TaxID=458836 RepID=UPI000EAC0EA4
MHEKLREHAGGEEVVRIAYIFAQISQMNKARSSFVLLCLACASMRYGLAGAQTSECAQEARSEGGASSGAGVWRKSCTQGHLGHPPKPPRGFPLIDETSEPASTYSTNEPPQTWETSATADWMRFVPDDTPLLKMSIPGTHDSGARVGGIAFVAQAWSISEQLEAGVRYLDIRTRRTRGQGVHALAIHHSFVFQDLWFNDVMDSVVAFLRMHPAEVVIMRLKGDEDTAEEGSKSYAEIWPDYMAVYAAYFAKVTSPLPTLGALRGKVYVLDDNADFSFGGAKWTSAYYRIQDNYEVYAYFNDYSDGIKVSLPTKREQVRQYLDIASDPQNRQWVFNHLSGSAGMAPRDVAGAGAYDGTNAAAYYHVPYSGKQSLGTVIMDFPGEQLVYRIVKSNFQAPEACGAKTFRVESAHSWAEFRLPVGVETQTTEIPAGAYNNYVFPTCNRVSWTDLTFVCKQSDWQRTQGTWDSDGLCTGSVPASPWVAVGDR